MTKQSNRPMNKADHYERVQMGLAWMMLMLGLAGMTGLAGQIWGSGLDDMTSAARMILLFAGVYLGLAPLLRAPSDVRDKVNRMSFLPRSFDELVDLFSLKAISVTLTVLLACQIMVFPIIEKLNPALFAEGDFFELGTTLIFLTYGLSMLVQNGLGASPDDDEA